MSKTARCISTSLVVLGLVAMAWAGPVPASAPLPTVAYLPGAEAAMDAAVLAGLRAGLRDARVRLVVGRRAARWSNAAPECVRLRLEEHARVLVTPPERRVAHLMAQVATRTQMHVVSTSAAPTVSATGSKWVVSATDTTPVDAAGWRTLGRRAATLALERLTP